MRASTGQRLVLALGLVACLLKGVFTAAVTPPFQTPDFTCSCGAEVRLAWVAGDHLQVTYATDGGVSTYQDSATGNVSVSYVAVSSQHPAGR